MPLWGWLTGLVSTQPKMPPNPPVPSGLRPWKGNTTAGMQQWASMIVGNPDKYPMGAIVKNSFNGRDAVARVEWHSWTHRNGKLVKGVFRGVTLYEPVESQAGSDFGQDWDDDFARELQSAANPDSQFGFGWPWKAQARRIMPKARPPAHHPGKRTMGAAPIIAVRRR